MSSLHTSQEKRTHATWGHKAPDDRFVTVMQESTDVFWLLTPAGEMHELSSSWQVFTGQRKHECLGRGWLDVFHPADQPQMEEALRSSVSSGHPSERVCHIRRGDETYHLVQVRTIPVRARNGATRELVVCGNDITTHELAEQLSHAQRQLAVNASRIGLWDWDLVTDRLVWSDQQKALFGLPPETPISVERFLEAVHPDDRQRADRSYIHSLAEQQEYTNGFRTIWPDGSVHWLESRARGFYDTHGQMIHLVGVTVDVTELRRAEEQITAILESITEAFLHVDPAWCLTYANRRAEEVAGEKREAMLGKCLWDIAPELLGTTIEQQMREAMRRQQAMHFEAVHPWQQRWLEVHAYPALDGISIYFQDITERKKIEESVQKSREELHLLTEIMPQLVWLAEPDGLVTYFNEQCYTYLDATFEQLWGNRWIEVIHPDDRQRTLTTWRHSLRTGQMYEIEYRLREGKTGTYQWFLGRASPLTDTQGHLLKWVGTCTNIDEKKRTEEALRQSRDAFRLLSEAIPQMVWIARPDGSLEYANQQWYDYTGSDLERLAGKGWMAYTHPDDHDKVQVLWQTSLLTSHPFEIEARLYKGKTGEYRWFLLRAMPFVKPDGHVWKWFGTATDLHEKKCAEEALRESEARFRSLMQSNVIGIMIASLDGQIHEANDAFLQLVGYTRKTLSAGEFQWTALMPPEYHERGRQAVETVLTTGTFQPFEKEYVRTDGKRVPVLIGGTYLHREDSSVQVMFFVVDLTAHKELERQKDLLLSMTGHELKTPLAALKGTFQLLARRAVHLQTQVDQLPPKIQAFFTDLLERLAAASRQVDVQTHLINDLLDASRITAKTLKLELERCDLIPLVRETVEDLRVTAPERSLVLEVPEQAAIWVQADRARISQVITNYVTNAIRYSPADQPIHIGLTRSADTVRVWVQDQGPGLSKEAQKDLWQRFHQVRGIQVQCGSGRGLGLGLYICQTLIDGHQGKVGVESAPGKGSTFWFTLPPANANNSA